MRAIPSIGDLVQLTIGPVQQVVWRIAVCDADPHKGLHTMTGSQGVLVYALPQGSVAHPVQAGVGEWLLVAHLTNAVAKSMQVPGITAVNVSFGNTTIGSQEIHHYETHVQETRIKRERKDKNG